MPSPSPLPPAQPTYILRGHSSPIHATTFIRENTRLVTGDADGWVIVWDLVSKRAVAVWRAHEGVVLGVGDWPRTGGKRKEHGDGMRKKEGGGEGKLITHGKDNLLLVWQVSESDEVSLSTVLPVDVAAEPRRKPWLLYSLEVNTMNFCSYACCLEKEFSSSRSADEGAVGERGGGLLVAVPNILTSETVDVFHLPSTRRLYTIPNDQNTKTGMIMALSIFYQTPSQNLTVVVGYESGSTMVSQLIGGEWKILYFTRCHDQPILNLDVDPVAKEWYLTSSADAIIGKHPIPRYCPLSTSNSGAEVPDPSPSLPKTTQTPSLLSQALASTHVTSSPKNNQTPSPPTQEIVVQTTPIKINQTKHSGQQSLRIRSDGKIFATAGWDSKIRVYSTKTLKEVAVLKWHGVGCFSVDFANVDVDSQPSGIDETSKSEEKEDGIGSELAVLKKGTSLTRDIKRERLRKVMTTHWVAAGSKDGKVSLWDIY